MANVLIRNLPAEVHRALKVRAALNDRSTDAEIREILTAAVQPLELEEIGREVGLSESDKKTECFTFVSPGLSAKGNTDQLVA